MRGQDPQRWSEVLFPVICVLAAAEEPLTVAEIYDFVKRGYPEFANLGKQTVRGILSEWREFLDETHFDGETCFRSRPDCCAAGLLCASWPTPPCTADRRNFFRNSSAGSRSSRRPRRDWTRWKNYWTGRFLRRRPPLIQFCLHHIWPRLTAPDHAVKSHTEDLMDGIKALPRPERGFWLRQLAARVFQPMGV